jgi:glycosyltransferase involved in cell wall biosynthesis
VLFIGRFVPQKAHRDAIQIVYSYLRNLDDAILLRFVGTVDEHFRGYFDELQTLVEALGIRDHIQITGAVPHSELIRLLRESTVFLCCSRHEGFCVPVIEAQAAGLPVVSVNAGALSETLGPGQIACEPPQSTGDYLFYAYVLREIARNSELRKMLITVGHRNVMTRFSPEIIQNQFITNLIPALKALQ